MSGRSRSWCFTLNNYSDADYQRIKAFDVRYLVIGKEVGASGTPHLQGYVVFSSTRTLSGVKKTFLPSKPHLEIARGSSLDNMKYCSKDGDFEEIGQRPMTASEKGEAEKERWVTALALVKEGRIDEVDPQIQIQHARNLHFIHINHVLNRPLADNDLIVNEWHYGPSGYGKSRSIRLHLLASGESVYYKAKNKWWDNYMRESAVVIDDIDPTHASKFGAFLKEWGDHYPFRAEGKGTSMMIRPRVIYVTSQYSIDEVFGNDVEAVSAMKRRYKSIKYSHRRVFDGVVEDLQAVEPLVMNIVSADNEI